MTKVQLSTLTKNNGNRERLYIWSRQKSFFSTAQKTLIFLETVTFQFIAHLNTWHVGYSEFFLQNSHSHEWCHAPKGGGGRRTRLLLQHVKGGVGG